MYGIKQPCRIWGSLLIEESVSWGEKYVSDERVLFLKNEMSFITVCTFGLS